MMEHILELLEMLYTEIADSLKKGDPFNTQIKNISSLATFSGEFSIIYKTLEKTALYT